MKCQVEYIFRAIKTRKLLELGAKLAYYTLTGFYSFWQKLTLGRRNLY